MSDPYTLKNWSDFIHTWAHKKGFWRTSACEPHSPAFCTHASGSRMACLMLVVSELGEAAEALRKNDEENFREEVADAVIRLLDLAAGSKFDIEEEVSKKMRVNEQRPHKHGKTC